MLSSATARNRTGLASTSLDHFLPVHQSRLRPSKFVPATHRDHPPAEGPPAARLRKEYVEELRKRHEEEASRLEMQLAREQRARREDQARACAPPPPLKHTNTHTQTHTVARGRTSESFLLLSRR